MEAGGSVVSCCAAVDAYVKKGAGIDLVLKSLLGITRLVSIYSSDKDVSENYAKFASSIINCRMLANHFRHVDSFNSGMTVLKKGQGPLLPRVLLMGSFFLRSLEQVFGDLNYYQSTFMRHWNRRRLSLGYWFFKSLALTCGFLNELLRLKATITSPQWRKQTSQERSATLKALFISIARYVCDMLVYYQWLPWYNPYKTFQYVCGSTAGILGIYVVWNDTQAARAAEKKVTHPSNGSNNGQKVVDNASLTNTAASK
ncbi:hypothetical protein DQ04_01521050 [Trypanosoma grayi]|uniref:hypothetical protein n=1 Tax=Trypanosoma grayi TaxID=71804 RepID=UPI0004F450E1|nr:hypothetical protein DQ04_01521050 [Trypanosoma grayi]KEG12678.1 hypothetical protein DQ04_01521050 [Trypanosoma grayi]